MIRLELCVGKPTQEGTQFYLYLFIYKTQYNKGH